MANGYRLGVDIGGTFTDFALADRAGAIRTHKRLTTPAAPERAVLTGLDAVLGEAGLGAHALREVVHGTTLVTNAVIERRGARVLMLVTAGFSDLLEIGREQRYDLYDLRLQYPRPLADRRARLAVDERMLYDGRVERPLRLEHLHAPLARVVAEQGIEAVAVCLLHAYVNPAHEEQLRGYLAREYPHLTVSLSSEVAPFMREYERWTTTIANAYTQPMVDGYLSRLEEGLRVRGFRGSLHVMTSSGGTAPPALARRFPVRLIESGPAAGALAAQGLAAAYQIDDALSFDMGGTTAKGALVADGSLLRRDQMEVARVHGYRHGSGLPLRIPVIDMIEIGSGGGSISGCDARGVIGVGPQSAGADPGPACYGLGGEEATLTDANVVLGYLDPGGFLGGRMRLDSAAAGAALDGAVAEPLGIDLPRAAWGVHETANEDVARAFRIHAAEHGFDYRRAAMIAFGGCGPMHALRIARKLRVPKVIFPRDMGVLSAIGLLASPLRFEVLRSELCPLDDTGAARLERRFEDLEREAAEHLLRAQVPSAAIRFERRLDLRYAGQGYELEVMLPGDEDAEGGWAAIPGLFRARYLEIFSIAFEDQPLEIVNWKVSAVGPAPSAVLGLPPPAAGARAEPRAVREIYCVQPGAAHGGFVPSPVYARADLPIGTRLEGPALIEEQESTCVLGPGDRLEMTRFGDMVVRPGRGGREG